VPSRPSKTATASPSSRATCAVERIDEHGLAWVSVWWNDYGSTFSTSVGLDSGQLEKARE